jgi:uncharacterized membrane protein
MRHPSHRVNAMQNLMLFLHLAAAVFWMGGMAFTVLALRPALAEQLQPPQRLLLLAAVLGRFIPVVAASIAILLATGLFMLMQIGMKAAPPGQHAMLVMGFAMMLIFAHMVFSPFRRFKQAVAAANWPEAGRRAEQITWLVKINLGLGWLAIGAVMLWR